MSNEIDVQIRIPREQLADLLESLPDDAKFVGISPTKVSTMKESMEQILRDADNGKATAGLVPPPSEEAEKLARSNTLTGTIVQAVREYGETVPASTLLRSVAEVAKVTEDQVNKAVANLIYNRRLFRRGKFLSHNKHRQPQG
jgi:uncharacterized protein (DUF885 family)